MSELVRREREFYNDAWQGVQPRIVEGQLIPIPGVTSLYSKRVLICSSGSGSEPVRAAKAGAEVYMFDISRTAVENTLRTAALNQVNIQAQVMNFENLTYENDFFDVIYGSAILHHVNCTQVAKEIYRCLKPGGVAYFLENSARNPLVRWTRRLIFGTPSKNQRQSFLFFRRYGTSDEYPLTDDEIAEFEKVFPDYTRVVFDEFVFFQLLYAFAFHKEIFRRLTVGLDNLTVRFFPGLMKYSYDQHIWMMKPIAK